MTTSSAEIIAKSYYDYVNSENWDALEKIIDDEIHFNYAADFSSKYYSPTMNYYMILGNDPHNVYLNFDKKLYEEHPDLDNYSPKSKMITVYRSMSQFNMYKQQFEIISIISQENRCWVHFARSDSYEREKITYAGNQYFWIKNSKIISILTTYDWLSLLIQQGKLITAERNKELIESYLGRLENLGIIPSSN